MNPINTPASTGSDPFWQHMPVWLWPVIIAGICGFFLYQSIQGFEGVANFFGTMGRRIYDRKTRKAAERAGLTPKTDVELEDLRRQVEFLTSAVDELRIRDEMTWAWILSDQEWHRNYEFICAEKGVIPMPRVSFMEFRSKWMAERGGPRAQMDKPFDAG